MKIVDYATIIHVDQQKFVESIMRAIIDGWVPFGGISVAASGNELVQVQALVKYAE